MSSNLSSAIKINVILWLYQGLLRSELCVLFRSRTIDCLDIAEKARSSVWWGVCTNWCQDQLVNLESVRTVNGVVWCDDLLVVPIFQHELIYRVRVQSLSRGRLRSLPRSYEEVKRSRHRQARYGQRREKKEICKVFERSSSNLCRIDSRTLRSRIRS